MSTALARRLDRVEGDRLAGAITHFADYCHRAFADPAVEAADPEEYEDTPLTLALWDVIELTTSHPIDHQGIRAALGTVAPFVVLTRAASPLAILTALEERLRRDMEG